eukprot:31346-Pelagococcus_subviridis.AAC.5
MLTRYASSRARLAAAAAAAADDVFLASSQRVHARERSELLQRDERDHRLRPQPNIIRGPSAHEPARALPPKNHPTRRHRADAAAASPAAAAAAAPVRLARVQVQLRLDHVDRVRRRRRHQTREHARREVRRRAVGHRAVARADDGSFHLVVRRALRRGEHRASGHARGAAFP